MYNIEHLSHTADICLRIEAESIEELFCVGAFAMNEILNPGICAAEGAYDNQCEISVQSIDLTALFIDFLSEILTLAYTEKTIFCKFKIVELSTHSVVASLKGKRAPEFHEDIKAVTYHDAEVHLNDMGNYESLVIFDI